jgi:hypothetical protein
MSITWRECVCKCGECGLNVTSKFFNVINEFRDAFDKPMVILSGARCEKRNKEVGGAKLSAHVEGRAVDVARTESLEKFCTEANLEKFGLWMEALSATPTWIHLTDRPYPSWKPGMPRTFKP